MKENEKVKTHQGNKKDERVKIQFPKELKSILRLKSPSNLCVDLTNTNVEITKQMESDIPKKLFTV